MAGWRAASNEDDKKKAANAIEAELDSLSQILPHPLEDLVFFVPDRKRDYPAFWQQAKDAVQLFKSSRLLPEDRERLWARYQDICQQVKDLQQKEREEKYSESSNNRSFILSVIRDARNWAGGARDGDDLRHARSLLGQAMGLMKEKFLLKDHREECWSAWQEVNEKIGFRRDQIHEGNYVTLDADVGPISSEATYGDPYEALRRIKDLQARIREAELTKDQRRWLREKLQRYWDTAIRRIEQRKAEKERKRQEWLKRQEEYRHKHEAWQERMEAKIDRLSSLIEKNEYVIQRIESQIDDLESKISSAWNDDWADRARGWVEEKYAKIRDIEQTNASLEAKITEIRSRMRN